MVGADYIGGVSLIENNKPNNTKQTRLRIHESEGSWKGGKYVSAAGAAIPSEGEHHVAVETEEGHRWKSKMQVTAMDTAVLSVSKIFDAGHEVGFTKSCGRMVLNETRQVVPFKTPHGGY